MDLKKIVINKIVMNWKKWNKFNLKLHMDGNALIITVAMCFFGNLRGCSLVEYIELELVTSCAPLRCYRPWLGGRQYYVDVFLLTLLESCVSTNHFTASNKSTQVCKWWSDNSIRYTSTENWNVVLHHLSETISWSSQGTGTCTCMLLVSCVTILLSIIYLFVVL